MSSEQKIKPEGGWGMRGVVKKEIIGGFSPEL